MTHLLFETSAIWSLANLVLCMAGFGYLLTVRDKSAATWWFLTAFGGFTLFSAYFFVDSAFYPDPTGVGSLLAAAGGQWFIWVAYLQFAYRFQENLFPREARVLLFITGGLFVVALGSAALLLFTDGPISAALREFFQIFHFLFAAVFMWATVVFIRKWRHSAHQTPSGVQAHRKRSSRAFALLSLMWLIDMLLGLAGQEIVWLSSVIAPAFVFGIILSYLNYAPEPTSIQVKLIGMSLVSVLAVFSIVSGFDKDKDQYRPDVSYQALRFTPDARPETAYLVETSDALYDTELGTDLQMGDDTVYVADLGFSFPFFGEHWDQLYIDSNGHVSFGEPLFRPDPPTLSREAEFYTYDVPKIVPLYIDLDPSLGGGVFYKQLPDRAVVTWHEIPQWSSEPQDHFLLNSMQLVLHQNGVIEMSYEDIGAALDWGFRGVMPGGMTLSEADLLAKASLSDGLPYYIAAHTARMEDVAVPARMREHEVVQPLIWLLLGSSLFIIGVFPFVFRSSLLKPLARVLEGVQRVNAGDLSIDVPVGIPDEIGRLTTHFNRMTGSLRRYHGEMEGLVAERTAQLEQSLDELKTTQAQLVQQEKMASLGQLTAGIAHEIKNPLNFVNNFAEVNEELAQELREALANGEDVQDIIADLEQNAQVIAKHGKRADSIVKSMMEHARGGEGQRQATDVNVFVEEYFNLAYHGMRAKHADFNATLKRDYDEPVGQVEMVPQEMGRVLINLLNNAFYAIHEKAQSVNGSYEPTVMVSTKQANGNVVIRVADNGLGIPEATQGKIFEPFFTTKPTGQGNTGLGLSLSYDIITQGHGGMLRVESTEGKGATFVITLPLNKAET